MIAIYLNSAWLAGIFFGSLVGFPQPIILFIATAASAILWKFGKCSLPIVSISLLAFFFGIARYDNAFVAANLDELSAFSAKGPVALRGVIAAEPDVRDRNTSFVMAVNEVRDGDQWIHRAGKIVVVVPRSQTLAYGEQLELKGKLDEPLNATAFDFKSYLAQQGIHYQMRYPRIVGNAPPAENDFLAVLYSFKRNLAHGLDLALPEPQAALANGILLGIRTSLPAELQTAFARTNTTHILAISGWNITMIAGLLRIIGGRFFRRKGLVVFVIGGIGLYTVLIGPQASVVRAAIMGSMLLVGAYFGRPSDVVVGLLFAATAMTAFNPMYLWDIGFQLSFASTLGIALLLPQLQRMLRFLPFWLADSVGVTLAAQLATLPIIGVVFGQFSTVTTLANALVLPATLPIMLLSAITALIAIVWLPLAQIVGFGAWVFLTYMIRIVECLGSAPWASISLGSITPLLALPYYALVAVLLIRTNPVAPKLPMQALQSISLKTKLMFGISAVCAVLAWTAFLGVSNTGLRVSFFDVGQGDAILIETPMGHRILVDGGPSPPRLLDALGRRMPFWDKSIDLVVLTHPNDDHLAGLIDVLERLDVKQVLESGVPEQSASYKRWREIVQRKKIIRTVASAGYEIDIEPGIFMQVQHPDGAGKPKSANESSVVMKLVAGNTSVLFTGDVDRESQRAMVRSGVDLMSTVLKVPHHGAANALDEAFLEAVRPSVAVVSVGKNNRFGHPAPETLEQLRDVQVLRTDLDGTIEVTIVDGKYEVRVSP